MSIFSANGLTVSTATAPTVVPPSTPWAVIDSGYGTQFGSTYVSIGEARAIALAVGLFLVTGSVSYTAPVSGITVTGSAGSLTVQGTSLTAQQAQQFFNQVALYCVTYK